MDKLTTILQLVVQKFATLQCQSPTSRHVKILGCGKFLSVVGEFVVQEVVELLRARPLVVLYNTSVAGVCVVEFGTKRKRSRPVIHHPPDLLKMLHGTLRRFEVTF